MKNDYLWDGKGNPDTEIEELEQVLGELRFNDAPLAMSSQSKRWTTFRVIAVAATIVITCTAGLWWLYPNTPAGNDPIQPVAETPAEQPMAIETPPTVVPAIEIPDPVEGMLLASLQEPLDLSGLDLETPMVLEPVYEDLDLPVVLTASEDPVLDSEDMPLFTAEDDLLEGEVTDHLEHAQLLLQSFRNVPLTDINLSDLDFEKRKARELLTDNMLLRRDTHASGDMETSDLLSRLETYLLDIANLQDDHIEVESIKNRIQRKEIIVALQIHRD